MTEARIRELLEMVAAGQLTADHAVERLRNLPFDDLGFARLDNHRTLRRGVPEVVFGDGKSAEQIALIGGRMAAAGLNLIVTRLAPEKARGVRRKLRALEYHATARMGVVLHEPPMVSGHGPIAVHAP